MPVSKEEHRAHLTEGMGNTCLVCDNELHGSWTDYNGQIRCWSCGTTYQILGSHFSAEFLEELGLSKEQVAKSYCDCFTLVPILRRYWEEKATPIPFGTYLGDGPITQEQIDSFYVWLDAHADEFRDFDDFDWDALKKFAATRRDAMAGVGI
jgi:hypothetical protein